MNISDKKFIELTERVWDRNKELVAENRELKDMVKKLKEELKETNARFNTVCDEQHDYISRLEEENNDLELANACLREEVEDLTNRIDLVKDILDDEPDSDESELGELGQKILADVFGSYTDISPIIGKTVSVEEAEKGLNITINLV